jgi:hypothetical protein
MSDILIQIAAFFFIPDGVARGAEPSGGKPDA